MTRNWTVLIVAVVQSATLLINSRSSSGGTWDGSTTGGHHREGILTFPVAAAGRATVERRLTGLPADVSATWTTP